MARGRRGGVPNFSGGANMNNLMKQAQKLQEEMAKAQEEIAEMEIENTAGGGMVTVKVNGDHKIIDLTIDPDALDPEDADILQDTIIAAINGAYEKLEEHSEKKMGGLGGLAGLGGFGL